MTTAPSRNGRRAAIGVALVGVIAALMWMRGSKGRAPEEISERAPGAPAGGDVPTTPAPAAAPITSVAKGVAAPAAAGGAPGLAVLKQSLADYLAVSVYPPWSRSHSAGSADKLLWNKPIADDLPLDDRPGHETVYHFDADKMHVPFGEAITSWIEVLKVGGSRPERLPLRVQSAWVMSLSGAAQGRTQQLEYNDEGRDGDLLAGDSVYTNRFVPSAVPQLGTSAQRVLIQAVIDSGEAQGRKVIRDFTYAPRRDIEILGATDILRDGMLVVALDVDVHQAGIYTFEGNVFAGAAGDQAVAYSEPSATLPLGRQKAELKFFGRAFHEKNLPGPYVVKDIRTFHRFISGEEENFYETYPKALVTKPYKVTDFSSSEWQSEDKGETIANMSRLIEQTGKGEIGQPLSPPSPSGVHHSDPIP